jgi:glutamine phosphoribosylpyrophosphate amidotransferase
MPNPTRIEINCETGVESIIELTDVEVAKMKYAAQLAAEKKADEDAAAAALEEQKLAVLKKLGLTSDEVTALLS